MCVCLGENVLIIFKVIRMTSEDNNTSKRGFGSMDPEKQEEVASKGGRTAHEKGTAHEFDSEEARKAGQKGGQASSNKKDTGVTRGRENWGGYQGY